MWMDSLRRSVATLDYFLQFPFDFFSVVAFIICVLRVFSYLIFSIVLVLDLAFSHIFLKKLITNGLWEKSTINISFKTHSRMRASKFP